jgi:alanine-synthesizing transaminase
VRWSERAGVSLAPNRLTQALNRIRADGRAIVDLTLSNPTQAGFEYPPQLLAPLADPRGLVYTPQPLGMREAREAIADDYARKGETVAPDRIVLTASTSEAYSLLFKVLCDPGDEVLVPRPSYPLFDHLSRFDAVVARTYDLEYHGGWSIAFDSIERRWSPRTRAVLIVSPNNPTGSFVSPQEVAQLSALCADRGTALVADEVFDDYLLAPGVGRVPGRTERHTPSLTFRLGGLSKSVGLPQAKLAWIAVEGPDGVAAEALERLELAADTYLSVATPVQLACRDLLRHGARVREQIQSRVRANYEHLRRLRTREAGCSVLNADGGWYAVVRVPAVACEEDLVLALLDDGVLTHPGYFFDFHTEAYLVVSLLTVEDVFAEGMARVLRHFACRLRNS